MTPRFKSVDGKPLRFYPTPERPIPRAILIGAGLLALLTVGLGLVSNRTGIGAFHTPRIETVASRQLRLDEADPSTVLIEDATTGEILLSRPSASGGFAIESLRNLERYRTVRGLATGGSYTLALKSDGRLVVEDPDTARTVELRAFGKVNAEVFAEFLQAKDRQG